MEKNVFLSCLIIIIGLFSVTGISQGAELRRTDRNYCKFELRGPIINGDTMKIKEAVKNAPYGYIGSICLNSPGGSYVEGLKLAKFLHEKGIGTVVDNGAECTSSCAIAFLGGTIKADDEPYVNRKLHVLGRLGFHAPYIPDGSLSGKRFRAEDIYRTAITALAQLMSMSPKMKIKTGLLAELAKRGPGDLFWIDTIDKAGRWNIPLFGYSLLKSSLIGKKHFVRACDNAYNWESGKHGFRVSTYTGVHYERKRIAGELRVAVGFYPPEGSVWCILRVPDEVRSEGGMFPFFIGELAGINWESVSSGFKYLPTFSIYPPDWHINRLPR